MTVEELQQQLAESQAKEKLLQEQLEAAKSTNNDSASLIKRLAEVEEKAKVQAEENKKIKLDLAKENIIKEFPHSASFRDHLVGANEDEIKAKAKVFHETVAKAREDATKEKEAEIKRAWGNIPQGGVPGMMRTDELDADLEKNKKEGNTHGMLRNKFTRMFTKMAEAK
jgi:hypothetical protein